jgi:hypothetical protein
MPFGARESVRRSVHSVRVLPHAPMQRFENRQRIQQGKQGKHRLAGLRGKQWQTQLPLTSS